MSYPQVGHPIGGSFALVCTIHHLIIPKIRTTTHPTTAPTASSDNTNQISSGHVSILNPGLNAAIILPAHPTPKKISLLTSCP